MKHYLSLLTIAIGIVLLGTVAQAQSFYAHLPEGKVVFETSNTQILVKFDANTSFNRQQEILATESLLAPLTKEMQLPAPVVTVAQIAQTNASEVDILEAIERLNTFNEVVYANPFVIYADGTQQGVQDRILVRLRSSLDYAYLTETAEVLDLAIAEHNQFDPNLFVLTTTKNTGKNAMEIAAFLHEGGQFEYAEPDFIRFMKRFSTNDPYLNYQWSLNNTGSSIQHNGTPGGDMSVFDAWSYTTGSPAIKVAILDEGVDLNHPDLVGNMLGGYDATGQGSGGDPSGDDAHGTACAGIVASVGNNGVGTAGVAYGSKIVPVRIAYSSGQNWVTSNAWIGDALNWSWQTAGADILSNSWGGGSSSSTINSAISGAVNNGRGGLGAPVLFAAGNDNSSVSYPATNNNTIAVIAMSMCEERKSPSSCDGETWWGSNYGTNGDIAAPGVKIAATDISGSAGYASGDYTTTFNGTSSACPNAAGVMALILSANPSLTESQARNAIESTCDKVGGYSYSNTSGQPNGTWSNELGHGRVNAEKAILSILPASTPNDAGISGIASPLGNVCSTSFVPEVTLTNFGSNNLTSVAINYQVDGGAISTYNWSGNLSTLASTSVTLPTISVNSGSHTFSASTVNPNGQNDGNTNNDGSSSQFASATNSLTLTIVLDQYGSETTWEIRDGSTTIASGGPYQNNASGTTVTENLCVEDGCFDFIINDSYGDGICCSYGNGSYLLVDDNNNTLASGGQFTSTETTNFCVSGAPPAPDAGVSAILSPTDACSLTGSETVIVTVNNYGTVAISNIPVRYRINGGSIVSGTVTQTINGGSSFDYAFSNTVNLSSDGNYTIEAWTVLSGDSNNGNNQTSDVISNFAAPSVSVSTTNASCGSSDGTATANVSGGAPPYNYQWSNGGTGTSISGLSGGTYSLTVEDANGCQTIQNFTINQASSNVLATITGSSDVSCNGGSNGAASVSGSGGTAPYSYLWSNGQSSSTATGLSAGSYSVTVSDANGCQDIASVSIGQPSALSASANSASVSCNGGNDGSASASASGGTAPYSYQWSNGSTSASISGLSAGSYSVTVTDANGCTASANTSISQPAALSLSFSVTDATAGQSNGSVNLSVSGGTSPYSYQWSNGSTSQDLNNIGAGTYSVTVTDNNGCSATGSATVQSASICAGATSSFPYTEGFESGTGAWSQVSGDDFDWTRRSGGTPSNNTGPSSAHGGTYYMYTESSTPNYSNKVAIFEGPCFDLAGQTSASLSFWYHMYGANNMGNLQLQASTDGGATWGAAIWSLAGNQGNSWQEATVDLTSFAGGFVKLRYVGTTGTTWRGDMAIDDLTLTAGGGSGNQIDVGVSAITAPSSGCGLSASEDVVVTITNYGSTSATNFDVSYNVNGGTAQSVTITSSLAAGASGSYTFAGSANLSIAGTYTVNAWTSSANDANNGNDQSSISVTNYASPTVTVSGSDASCSGGNDGSATASVSGGASPYSYQWSNGGSGASISGLGAGNYTVTVTDANGCSSTGAVTISSPSALSLSFVVNDENNGASDGSINLTVSGGVPAYAYQWSNGANSEDISGLSAGNYSVTVTDVNGCSTSGSATVQNITSNNCSNTISSFPYTEGFEGNNFGDWSNASGDDFNWSVNSGGTPSNNTGPGGANSGTYYAYVESSAPNYSNLTTILESACFDLSGQSNMEMSFWYHMYGSTNMGNLQLQVSTNGGNSWSAAIWALSGNQGNNWQEATVDLSAYSGTIKLRFVGTTGTTWQGDMAIDDLYIGSAGGGTPVTYCPSLGQNTQYEWIDQVAIGSISNPSGNNGGYADFTNQSTSAAAGATVSFSLTPGFASTVYDEYWAIWIDYNQDGDFDDAGELAFNLSTASQTTVTGNFTIPASATNGSTRMRVQMKWGAAIATSCETFSYGEVEDYTLNISGGSALIGNPSSIPTPTASIQATNAMGMQIMNLYPNPATDWVNVSYRLENAAASTIRVLDINGKMVQEQQFESMKGENVNRLSLDNLNEGSYFIMLETNGTKQMKPFVIVH